VSSNTAQVRDGPLLLRECEGHVRCVARKFLNITSEEEAMVYRTMMAAVSVACLISTAAAAQEAAAPTIIPAETLKWNPTPFPEVTAAVIAGNPMASGMYAIFAKYSAGAKSSPHTRPDQRVVTVISGTYYAGAGTEFDESKLKPLKPGTTIVVPANSPHYASAKDGETIVQEVGIGPTGTNIWPKAAAK
jgi:quercetin dioxygenase-like cupin family protein